MLNRLSVVFLFVACLYAIFGQVVHYPFVELDDLEYVAYHPVVNSGIHTDSLKWIFQTGTGDTWEPLSWFSHLFVAEFFSNTARAHHAFNLVLHFVSLCLVYSIALRLGTGRRTAFVFALIFGLHPLVGEAVVWVSGRNTLLATLFALLSVRFYLTPAGKYEAEGEFRHSLSAFFFSVLFALFAYLSKPTTLILPLLFPVFDCFVLQRRKRFVQLSAQKLPFFVLAFFVAYLASRQVPDLMQDHPFGERLLYSLLAWTHDLKLLLLFEPRSVWVPYPELNLSSVFLALGTILFTALFAFSAPKKRPLPAAVWLLFSLCLLPTLGLLQARDYLTADRYLYLPLALMCPVLALQIYKILPRDNQRKVIVRMTGIFLLVLFAFLSKQQSRVWKDSESLFRHAAAVWPNSDQASTLLANLYLKKANHAKDKNSERNFLQQAYSRGVLAMELNPDRIDISILLTEVARRLGYRDKVFRHAKHAVLLAYVRDNDWLRRHYPEVADIYVFLAGHELFENNNPDEALRLSNDALQISPRNINAYLAAGFSLMGLKNDAGAMLHFEKAVELGRNLDLVTVKAACPGLAKAYYHLGVNALQKEDKTNAVFLLQTALQINPDSPAGQKLRQINKP